MSFSPDGESLPGSTGSFSPQSSVCSEMNDEIKRHMHFIEPKAGYVTEYEDKFRDPAAYKYFKSFKKQQTQRRSKGSPKSSTSQYEYHSAVLPGFHIGGRSPVKDASTIITDFDSMFLDASKSEVQPGKASRDKTH